MGKQNQDSDESGFIPQEDFAQKVEIAIKALPTLQQKIQAIAINGYIEQKKAGMNALEKEINKIKLKHRLEMQPFFDKINAIVQGSIELKDEDFEGVNDIFAEHEKLEVKNHYTSGKLNGFWLKVLQNDMIVGPQIRECDQPILQKLSKLQAFKTEDQTKLTLKLYFQTNDYFTNNVLQKHFDIQQNQISKSYGTTIDWKDGKNITVKIVKKKNKNKKTGQKVLKTKQVKQQSFFNLFKAIEINDDQDSDEQKVDQQIEELEQQYQLANQIYEQTILDSVETFLGMNDVQFCQGGDFGQFDEDQEQQEQPKPKKNKKTKRKSSGSKSKSKSKK